MRRSMDLVLHLLGWTLAFGAALEFVAVHPEMFLYLTGCAASVVARRLI